jgi:hypothetical protein
LATVARVVSDEVWRQLDPNAGRLSRRTAARLTNAAGIAFLAYLAGILLWLSGVVVARIDWPDSAGYGSVSGPDIPLSQDIVVTNRGWLPVTVVGAGRNMPGLHLLSVQGGLPRTLHRGEQLTIQVQYQVVDCAAVPTGEWPVPVRVRMWWGVQTVYIGVPRVPGPIPDGLIVEPVMRQWQDALARNACHRTG